MNLFEIVKASVSVPESAKAYGLDVTHHNMARCPFHDDRHPSLKMSTQVRKYSRAFGEMKAEKEALEAANEALTDELKESRQESVLKKMADLQLRRDYDKAVSVLERIPREIIDCYAGEGSSVRKYPEFGR